MPEMTYMRYVMKLALDTKLESVYNHVNSKCRPLQYAISALL